MARAVGPKGTVTAWLASQFAGDAKGKAKWAGILGRTPNAHVLEQPRSRNSGACRQLKTLPCSRI
ncbi:MAG: hypothetical protein IPO97_09995 [Sphingomonadales bacterium]|nr:hypothetical protein [Sphingomonadales bacterium]